MDFSNNIVQVQDIPAIEEVTFRPLEDNYLLAVRIAFGINFLLFGAALTAGFVFITKLQIPWLMYVAGGLFAGLSLLIWVGNNLNYRYSGYALRQKDVLYRSGWFVHKTNVLPINRIQHISVQSGPIERRFGLASVSIFTAGGSSADFTIKGITDKTANQVKDWLSELIKTGTDEA